LSNRLVTFGCSFTYGEGLPNCNVGNNHHGYSLTPSDHAWPSILSRLTNMDLANNAKPGSSNLEILYHILNFNFRPGDVVVVMWTFPNRDLHFISTSKKIKPFRQLGLWLKHAELYLKSLGVDYIHYPINPTELNLYKPNFIPELDNYYADGFVTVDQCEADPHPGTESHKHTADKIFQILKNEFK